MLLILLQMVRKI